ncbi:MAG: hypothetical protein ACP5D7_15055 [Limnospira sp.]
MALLFKGDLGGARLRKAGTKRNRWRSHFFPERRAIAVPDKLKET